MKVSVSLPAEDVETLDEYARASGLPSRSAAVQKAIRLLRMADLDREYEAAWAEWSAAGGQADWEATIADGLSIDPR